MELTDLKLSNKIWLYITQKRETVEPKRQSSNSLRWWSTPPHLLRPETTRDHAHFVKKLRAKLGPSCDPVALSTRKAIWMKDPNSKNDQDESWTSLFHSRHHVDKNHLSKQRVIMICIIYCDLHRIRISYQLPKIPKIIVILGDGFAKIIWPLSISTD